MPKYKHSSKYDEFTTTPGTMQVQSYILNLTTITQLQLSKRLLARLQQQQTAVGGNYALSYDPMEF